MSQPQIITDLEQSLGLTLTHIDNIQQYMEARYPASYLEVMTPEEEMVGSMYSRYAFTEGGKLVGLNLYECEVGDEQLACFQDAEFDERLRHIRSINLNKTQITAFTLSKNLPELVFVTLNENEQLTKVKCERGLSKLARLEITETSITQFQIPPGYDSLYYLDLSSNKELKKFQFGQGGCKNLQVLFVRGTALKTFTLPAGFEKLVHLYLNNNKLEELYLKSQLPQLSCLQLKGNVLTSLDKNILDLAPNLDSWFIGKNNLPEELSFRVAETPDQDHLPIIQEYFAQREFGLEKNNECKVLLIGNGKAGKSAIVNRIVNDDFDPNWNSTHGISLLDKDLGEYHLNYWDFGGQDIYHATHRLFMQKNAAYILAWSIETEDKETPSGIFIEQADGTVTEKMYRNHALRYWLEYAKHLGEGSPMHVVQTKKDLPNNPIQTFRELEETFQNDFKPHLTFHQVECSDDDPFDNGFDQLLQNLETSVASIKKEDTIAKPLFDIRKFLRDQQKAGIKTISFQDYEKKALELQVSSYEKMLETWLFKSGVVYYQPGKFNNEIILDQGWAIEAIYTLFDRNTGVPDKIRASKGVFTGAFVQDIWRKNGYKDQDTHELFISFMKSCDLCFEVESSKEKPAFRDRVFMVPQLLENERPKTIDDFWEGREAIYYRYTDEFIHEGIIHSFISKTAYLATLRGIWQIGIQIKEENQFAWIEAGKNQINIRLTANARPLLNKIRGLLTELQGNSGVERISQDGKNYEPYQGIHRETPDELKSTRSLAFDRLLYEQQYSDVEKLTKIEPGFEADKSLTVENEAEKLDLQNRVSLLEKKVTRMTDTDTAWNQDPIIFLTANPHQTTKIQTRAELTVAIAELTRGQENNLYRFMDPVFSITITELIRSLTCKPKIIHFSGHGIQPGIILHTETEQPQLLPIAATQRVFGKLVGNTDLIILNACYSEAQAKAISVLGMYVIGTIFKVNDDAAVSFTKGFYGALGRGETYKECFNDALAIVMTEHPGQEAIYKIWHNGNPLNW